MHRPSIKPVCNACICARRCPPPGSSPSSVIRCAPAMTCSVLSTREAIPLPPLPLPHPPAPSPSPAVFRESCSISSAPNWPPLPLPWMNRHSTADFPSGYPSNWPAPPHMPRILRKLRFPVEASLSISPNWRSNTASSKLPPSWSAPMHAFPSRPLLPMGSP